ncbi:conserved hypothetical protein [Agrobacterium salinitolerans str. Hayward 0363]|nr:conserved hypothetical protein [Agrobacterium salinitolerans str. Hayward 0363]
MLKRVDVFLFSAVEGGSPRRTLSEYVAGLCLATQIGAVHAERFERLVVEVQKGSVDMAADLTLACFNDAIKGGAEERFCHCFKSLFVRRVSLSLC